MTKEHGRKHDDIPRAKSSQIFAEKKMKRSKGKKKRTKWIHSNRKTVNEKRNSGWNKIKTDFSKEKVCTTSFNVKSRKSDRIANVNGFPRATGAFTLLPNSMHAFFLFFLVPLFLTLLCTRRAFTFREIREMNATKKKKEQQQQFKEVFLFFSSKYLYYIQFKSLEKASAWATVHF